MEVIKNEEDYSLRNFIWLLKVVLEYRSIIYFRLGPLVKILNIFANGRELLYILGSSTNIGIGLVLQHGYSTVINAATIGKNFQIWHNVTIGTNKSHSGNLPTIKNNVKICTGAIVLGSIIFIIIGNNVVVSAGSVVTKSISDNSVVVGNPAVIIKQNGVRVNIKL